MISKEQVYCCCCRQLVPKQKASLIFQTGYYKAAYFLAKCADCTGSTLAEMIIAVDTESSFPINSDAAMTSN